MPYFKCTNCLGSGKVRGNIDGYGSAIAQVVCPVCKGSEVEFRPDLDKKHEVRLLGEILAELKGVNRRLAEIADRDK